MSPSQQILPPPGYDRKTAASRFFRSWVFFLLVFAVHAAWADEDNWQSLPTKYTVLHFQSLKDLELFNSDIDYASGGVFQSLFGGAAGKDLKEQVVQKVDALFVRAQEILDMRKYMRRVQINLYPNKEALAEAYQKEVKKPGELRAWYTFEQHTIYVQVEDVNEGMLAHEMAHAIIDHFLQVRPPPATAEILARYVDAHLKD